MARVWRVLAGLMASLTFLAAPAFGVETVVCFGSHGHVGIEAAQDGHCVSESCTKPGLPSAFTKLPISQCDPCLDVAFSQQPALAQSNASGLSKNLRITPASMAADFDCAILPVASDSVSRRAEAAESPRKTPPIRLACVLQI